MGCHFCQDELIAVFAILGSVRFIPMAVRSMWAKRHQRKKAECCNHQKCHKEGPYR